MPADPETGFDRILGFSLPDRDSRGRIVRLGPVIESIISAHDYPPAMLHCLSEALVLTALMGSLLKGEGDQLTMQAQSANGAIRLLVCDYRDGELRGYAEQANPGEPLDGANLSLETLFAQGHLAITFDIAPSQSGAEKGQRYQGIVPLEGSSLSEAVENYFAQSEQVPTLLRTAITTTSDSCIAAGLLLQHLPEGEEGRERLHVRLDHPEWEHVTILGGTIAHSELVDPSVSMEAVVWRLFHEERQIRTTQGHEIVKGCRCSATHFESVLARFPKIEREEMANEDGIIVVDCAFCSKEFAIQD